MMNLIRTFPKRTFGMLLGVMAYTYSSVADTNTLSNEKVDEACALLESKPDLWPPKTGIRGLSRQILNKPSASFEEAEQFSSSLRYVFLNFSKEPYNSNGCLALRAHLGSDSQRPQVCNGESARVCSTLIGYANTYADHIISIGAERGSSNVELPPLPSDEAISE